MKRFLIAVLTLVCLSACSTKWNVRYGVPEEALYRTESIPRLMTATKDEDPRVRVAAIRFLYKFSDPSIMETLRTISETDSDPRVRRYAQKAIVASMKHAGVNRVNPPAQLPVGTSKVEIMVQTSSVFFNGERNWSSVKDAGILPIRIRLRNLSETPLKIETSAFNLLMPDGRPARFANPADVNAYARPCGDYRGSCTTVSNTNSQGIWARITMDPVKNEQIGGPRVYPEFAARDGLIEGYVFFSVPPNLTSLENWKFEMGIRQNEGLYIIEDTFFGPIAVKSSANAPGAAKSVVPAADKAPAIATPRLEPMEEED